MSGKSAGSDSTKKYKKIRRLQLSRRLCLLKKFTLFIFRNQEDLVKKAAELRFVELYSDSICRSLCHENL